MDTKNLAIVFGIFGNDDELKGGDLLSIHNNNVSLSPPKISRTLGFDSAGIGYVHGGIDHSLSYNIR